MQYDGADREPHHGRCWQGKASEGSEVNPALAGAELWKIAQNMGKLVDLPLEDDATKQLYVNFARPYLVELCTDRMALNLETVYRHNGKQPFDEVLLLLLYFCC